MHILQKIPLELLRSDILDENYRIRRPILWDFEAAEIAHIENKYPQYSDDSKPFGKSFKQSERKQIVQTWHKHFPETHLQINKNVREPHIISKRIGPILSEVWFGFEHNRCRVSYLNWNLAFGNLNSRINHKDLLRGTSETIYVGTWE